MNEKEKQEFHIANCKCCLLAEVMKTCSSCRFNIGLAWKQADVQPTITLIRVELFVLTEQQ